MSDITWAEIVLLVIAVQIGECIGNAAYAALKRAWRVQRRVGRR